MNIFTIIMHFRHFLLLYTWNCKTLIIIITQYNKWQGFQLFWMVHLKSCQLLWISAIKSLSRYYNKNACCSMDISTWIMWSFQVTSIFNYIKNIPHAVKMFKFGQPPTKWYLVIYFETFISFPANLSYYQLLHNSDNTTFLWNNSFHTYNSPMSWIQGDPKLSHEEKFPWNLAKFMFIWIQMHHIIVMRMIKINCSAIGNISGISADILCYFQTVWG